MEKRTYSPFVILQFSGATVAVISCCFLLYQFLVELNHPTSTPLLPNMFLIIILIVGSSCFMIGYFKEKEHPDLKRKRPQLLRKIKKETDEDKQQKQIIKPTTDKEVAAWKVDGMRQVYDKAKYELNVYIRDLEVSLSQLSQQEKELYIIHDLIMRLMKELINDKVSLSCVEINLIFSKLGIYHTHHEKRLYESYKVHLTVPQQHHLDLLLDPRTREIISFLLKERYAFLPAKLGEHLLEAVKNLEKAADSGNVHAQFDLANVYLSSEFYGGMEAAIFYLHRADNAHHAKAGELLHQLQSA